MKPFKIWKNVTFDEYLEIQFYYFITLANL